MRLSKGYFMSFIIVVLIPLVLSIAASGQAAERCIYKFDNVILVFDRSGSMLEKQPGSADSKFVSARDIAANIAEGIPEADEGTLFMGLKIFGFYLEDEPLKTRTVLVRQRLNRQVLTTAIDSFYPSSGVFGYLTPLAYSMADLRKEAEQWPGRTAIFIISDGQDTTFFGKPVQEAKLLKEAKNDVALFTVLVGQCKTGRQVMQSIASVGGGRFFEASEFMGSARRDALLRQIFLDCALAAKKPPEPTPPPVVAPAPMRPEPQPEVKVEAMPEVKPEMMPEVKPEMMPEVKPEMMPEAKPMPMPEVKPEVSPVVPPMMKPEAKPEVPPAEPQPAARPEMKPEPGPPVTDDMFPVILFDFDRFSIRPSEKPKMKEAATILQANPDVRISLQGHTDSIGTDEYNLALSDRRAKSVKVYLNKFFDIAGERLNTVGFGESRPVAPNDTPENRQKNRRVEFKVLH